MDASNAIPRKWPHITLENAPTEDVEDDATFTASMSR